MINIGGTLKAAMIHFASLCSTGRVNRHSAAIQPAIIIGPKTPNWPSAKSPSAAKLNRERPQCAFVAVWARVGKAWDAFQRTLGENMIAATISVASPRRLKTYRRDRGDQSAAITAPGRKNSIAYLERSPRPSAIPPMKGHDQPCSSQLRRKA